MTHPAPRVPTPLQLEISLMGRAGKGPADAANFIGALVDQGYDYTSCKAQLEAALAALVAKGKLERCERESHYQKGATWTEWRLPSKAKLEKRPADPWFASTPDADVSSAAEQASGHGALTPSTREAPASGNRVITPEQFRELAARKRK